MSNLTFNEFEVSVISLIESKNKGLHKTLSGKFVKIGSSECGKDIQARIEDITHHRDMSPHRSDARIYYTGLLRVLGRQLRENDRVMATQTEKKIEPKETKKKLKESSFTSEEVMASRIMKLAGIF